MNYWLLKTEPGCYSIDDLKKEKTTAWSGVRNYQARNLMRDHMRIGDLVLFYHSNAKPSGVYGVARVVKESHPDDTQFDKTDEHYDPKATKENPIWFCVTVEFVKQYAEPVSLEQIKFDPKLEGMAVRQKGNRLSVQPVSKKEFEYIDTVLAQ